jgi:hypothetical protein
MHCELKNHLKEGIQMSKLSHFSKFGLDSLCWVQAWDLSE